MNYYTSTIPISLAEKLKDKGMPMKNLPNSSIEECLTEEFVIRMSNEPIPTPVMGIHKYALPEYCEVFDWLMEKDVHIRIESSWDTETQIVANLACSFYVEKVGIRPIYVDIQDWHEAANAAINKALTLI